MNPDQDNQSDVTEFEPIDEAARQAAIDDFHAKVRAQSEKENRDQVKVAPHGSLKEKMEVIIVWKDRQGQTWSYPGVFRIKGVFHNGRLNMKLVKSR